MPSPVTTPRKDTTNGELLIRIEQLADTLNECYTSLRGHGQETGYLARVERLEEQVRKFLNGDFAKLKTELLQAIKDQGETLTKNFDLKIARIEEIRKEDLNKTIQWPKILSGFIVPLITALVTAVTVAYALTEFGLK